VLCGPAERKRAEGIVLLANHPRVFSLARQDLSIGLTKACLRRSRLLVSTDSGPRHFAAAFGVPVVSLFGPTHIAWSDTHYQNETYLQIPVDCGPCQKPVCPLRHHKCMKELSVDMVFDAVSKRIGAHN
jgi:heptosyltransferase-2